MKAYQRELRKELPHFKPHLDQRFKIFVLGYYLVCFLFLLGAGGFLFKSWLVAHQSREKKEELKKNQEAQKILEEKLKKIENKKREAEAMRLVLEKRNQFNLHAFYHRVSQSFPEVTIFHEITVEKLKKEGDIKLQFIIEGSQRDAFNFYKEALAYLREKEKVTAVPVGQPTVGGDGLAKIEFEIKL